MLSVNKQIIIKTCDVPQVIVPFIIAHNYGLTAIIKDAPLIYASIPVDSNTILEDMVNTVQCLYQGMVRDNESQTYFNKWVDIHFKLFCYLGGIEDATYI